MFFGQTCLSSTLRSLSLTPCLSSISSSLLQAVFTESILHEVKVIHIYKCQPVNHIMSSGSRRSGLGSPPINQSALLLHLYSSRRAMLHAVYNGCDTEPSPSCSMVFLSSSLGLSSGFCFYLCYQHCFCPVHLISFPLLLTLYCSVLLWTCTSALQALLKLLSLASLPHSSLPSASP